MSERSSFVTEYIYCQQCFAAAKEVLSGDSKYLCASAVRSWIEDDQPLPIIAGKHGGLGAYDDRTGFHLLMIQLRDKICHDLRVAFLLDSTDGLVYFLSPQKPISIVDCEISATTRYALDEERIEADRQEYAEDWAKRLRRE